MHKQRIRFRKKWNYDTSSSSSCMRCDFLFIPFISMTLSTIPVMKRRMIRMRRRSRLEQRRRGKLLLIRMEKVRETMETLEKRMRMTRRNMMMTISRQRTQPTREKRSKMAGKFLRLKHMMF